MSMEDSLMFIRDIALAGIETRTYEAVAMMAIKEVVGAKHRDLNNLESTVYELEIARCMGKISAIKAYRDRTGSGLKDAKDAIERDCNRVGIRFNGLYSVDQALS